MPRPFCCASDDQQEPPGLPIGVRQADLELHRAPLGSDLHDRLGEQFPIIRVNQVVKVDVAKLATRFDPDDPAGLGRQGQDLVGTEGSFPGADPPDRLRLGQALPALPKLLLTAAAIGDAAGEGRSADDHSPLVDNGGDPHLDFDERSIRPPAGSLDDVVRLPRRTDSRIVAITTSSLSG